MRPLSATECIQPAIDRTKALLRPFSLRLWLKLGAVALLAEMGGQFFVPPMGGAPHGHSFDSGIGAIAGGITFLVLAILGIVSLVIWLALFYFGSRMQLVLMDLVATHSTMVAPAWRRTAPRTWRWIGLKLVFFLAVFIVIGAIAALPIISFIRSMPAEGAQPSAAFFGSFALFFVAIFAVVIIAMVAIWFLRDFVLPFVLFEDAPFGAALSNAASLVQREPGSVFFYFFMKLVLCLVAGIAAELCIFLGLLVLAIPLGILGSALWFGLHQTGPFGTTLMYISFALLGIVAFAAFIALILCIGGATLVFYQAYALYFIGGRIPRVGDVLDRSMPPPAFPPPYYPPAPPLMEGRGLLTA